VAGAGEHPAIDEAEKTRKPQIGDDDHHPEQQDDRVEIDRLGSLFERESTGGYHQAPADERGAGPVEPESGQPSDRDHKVSHRKNGDRNSFGQESR
jgi:hypothetical protein